MVFVPIFVIGFVLHFCAVITNEDFPLYYSIAYSIVLSFEMFTFSIKDVLLKELVLNNQFYSIAVSLLYFTASFNTVLIILILIRDFFQNYIKLSIIRNKEHYIVVGSNEYAINFARKYPKKTILILDKLDKEVAKELIEDGITILQENKINSQFIRAGINKNGFKKVIVLRDNDEDNLKTAIYLEKLNSKNCKIFIDYEKEHDGEWIKISNSTKGKIHFFSLEGLLGRLFIAENPLLANIELENVSKIKGIFLGFGYTNKNILKHMIINNCFGDIDFSADIYDIDIKKQKERFQGIYNALWDIDILSKKEYYDLPIYPTHKILNFYSNDILSYEFKKNLSGTFADYNYIMIALGSDKLNTIMATKLDDYLRLQELTNYKIFVKLENAETSVTSRIFTDSIKIFGNKNEIMHHFIELDEDVDLMAKRINAFYYKVSPTDINKINEVWDNLDYFEKESNRYAAYHIQTKLNLMGLKIDKKTNIEKPLSLEEYQSKLSSNNMRTKLGSIEHDRWNAFHIMNNYLPMKKECLSVDKERQKVIRKNPSLKRHLCITTLEDLKRIEISSYELLLEAGVSKEKALKESNVIGYDYDVIDHLFEIIEATPYAIESIRKKED